MALKVSVRGDMKKRLKLLGYDNILEQSKAVLSRLCDIPAYTDSTGCCLYLSMAGEVNTELLLDESFKRNKIVFIPKIIGKRSEDMFMLEVATMSTINDFDKNNWGIPEPSIELISTSQDGTHSGLIDIVLLPGVAFDKHCNRIGHGKGYYDSFVDRVTESNVALGKPAPLLIGLALNEQIIDSVPTDAHDRRMDIVVSPSGVFFKE